VRDDSRNPGAADTERVDPLDRLRFAGKRMTDPMESLAQRVAERVIGLLMDALDVNALVRRVDVNAVLSRVDIDVFLKRVDVNNIVKRVDINDIVRRADVNDIVKRVDVNELVGRVDLDALLDRVDVNELVRRVDVDGLVEQTDLGAIIARSSGGIGSEALDAARSQAVGLDQFIDRWVQRALRRKQHAPLAPPALLDAKAEP